MRKYYFPITRRSVALIIVGVLTNIICFSIATNYSIPFFLDAVGTFLAAVLMGPLAGAVTGILSTIVFGMGAIFYALPIIGASFVVGKLIYRQERIDAFRVISTGVLSGFVSAILALPTNLIINGGMTGNEWGDALVEMLFEQIRFKPLCSLAGGLFINIPDKFFTLLFIVFLTGFFRKAGVTLTLTKESEESETSAKKGLGGFFALLLAAVLTLGTVPVMPAVAEDGSFGVDFSAEYAKNFYGVEEGLSSAEINTIAQTGDGYIWAGAYSGLYRYNGVTFEQAALDERIANVMALYSDRKGRLWIGTNDSGVACYDPYSGEIIFVTKEEGLPSNSVRDICEDEKGNIYVATATYLCRLSLVPAKDKAALLGDGENSRKRSAVDKEASTSMGVVRLTIYDEMTDITYAYSLVSAGDNRICGVTDTGTVFLVDNDKLVGVAECEDEGFSYSCISYYGNDNFLVGTTGSRAEYMNFSSGTFNKVSSMEIRGISGIDCLAYNSSLGGFFVGATDGFGFVSKAGQFQNFNTDNFNSTISDVMVDRQGNIWFTSTKHGISKFSANPFKDLFRKGGLAYKPVNAILLDGAFIYVGTDSGLMKLEKSSGKAVEDERLAPLSNQRIRHIMKDQAGSLWISTYGPDGLVRVGADGEYYSYNRGNTGIKGSKFRFVLELSDGRILAASTEGVSFIKNGAVIATLGEADGLTVPKILGGAEDADGTIWLGTDGGGVYTVKDGKVEKHFGKNEGLQSEVVMKIVPCTGGRIYVGSNGLYFHGDGEDTVRKLTHFPYNNNYDVYIGNDGRAFVSSSAGLYVVSEAEMLADEGDYSYALLNRKRGLTTTLTANAFSAAAETRIYLCCTEGVRVLEMGEYDNFDSHYQIVLRGIFKDGEPVSSVNGIYNIPAGAGQVKILPAVLNYTVSDPLINISLEGSDYEDLTMRQSDLGEIYYPSLPYGTYNLKVRVLSDSGGDVKKEMTFILQKDSKLYERAYYKVYLCANIMMLLAFLAWLVAKMGNMAVINSQYEQIREAKEDAEMANKAKSNFLAQMSHEIRTPINAVLGMDEMILRESSEPDIKAYAYDIYNAGNTLLSLINDILDSSKIESGKMEIVPVEYELSGLIRDLTNMISQRAQAKDLKLEVEADPDLPKVLFGDDVRIRQVVTNILTNAVKYTNTGTVWLRFGGSREGDKLNLHVEVEDTGIGIKAEDLPKLFEAYQRIEEGRNRKIEGTGLGMNITVQLLRLMGSHLEVTSIYGKGSKFYFDLTQGIVDGSAMGNFNRMANGTDAFAVEDRGFTAPDAKVLVVDDNSMNRKVFRSLLKRLKVQVDEASGGMEALAKVEMNHYDFIFMDHMMPEMDGVETMKRMRGMECCNGIPIYVLTANAVTGAREEYMKMGFDGFIAKPVAADKLEEALREALPDDMKKPLTEEEKKAMEETTRGKSNPLPDELPDVDGLDWNYAWLHLPSMEMLKDGVQSFYDILELQADKLQEFYDEIAAMAGADTGGAGVASDAPGGFMDQYRIQVHGMKSAAATIGIVPLAGAAKILEFAALAGRADIVLSVHPTFINEWRSYGEKLRGVFGLGADEENAADKETGDKALLGTMLDMLAPAMEDLDIDTADEIMLRMKDFTYGPEIDEKIKKLGGAVKNLDEDMAGSIMEEIRNLL